ncbi:11094_t:CDS:2 [Paraglomus occultum]|uniref:11094_t:CDS:1 n=1 Tax=Paraglomus occultum TaxID=144539 RepID=A0A9N8Z1T1_9GLOM|nr:11094_t:CDS:2 [Paraglomus occultum]
MNRNPSKFYPVKDFLTAHSYLVQFQEKEESGKSLTKAEQAKQERIYELRDKVFVNMQKELANYYEAVINGNYLYDDLAENGVHNTSEIMRLCELGEILIRDYRETDKKELAIGKHWLSLTPEQQEKLIRYWSYEKARIENNFLTTTEQLEKQSQEHLKDIESAKFHEERVVTVVVDIIVSHFHKNEIKENTGEEIKGIIPKLIEEVEKRAKAESEKKVLDTLHDDSEKGLKNWKKRVEKFENVNKKYYELLLKSGIKLEKSDHDDTPFEEWKRERKLK